MSSDLFLVMGCYPE